jgi:hypothetical protein
MSVNTNSPEATFDDDTSQGIDEPTSVNAATFSNHGENAPTNVGDHRSDNGLTIIATAASQMQQLVFSQRRQIFNQSMLQLSRQQRVQGPMLHNYIKQCML